MADDRNNHDDFVDLTDDGSYEDDDLGGAEDGQDYEGEDGLDETDDLDGTTTGRATTSRPSTSVAPAWTTPSPTRRARACRSPTSTAARSSRQTWPPR